MHSSFQGGRPVCCFAQNLSSPSVRGRARLAAQEAPEVCWRALSLPLEPLDSREAARELCLCGSFTLYFL